MVVENMSIAGASQHIIQTEPPHPRTEVRLYKATFPPVLGSMQKKVFQGDLVQIGLIAHSLPTAVLSHSSQNMRKSLAGLPSDDEFEVSCFFILRIVRVVEIRLLELRPELRGGAL